MRGQNGLDREKRENGLTDFKIFGMGPSAWRSLMSESFYFLPRAQGEPAPAFWNDGTGATSVGEIQTKMGNIWWSKRIAH